MDWFLYDNGLRHERVKMCLMIWNLQKVALASTFCESDVSRVILIKFFLLTSGNML